MKFYNKCQGCGLKMQSTNENEIGFVPNNESPICKKCFRSKNYGEFSNNISKFYKIDEIKEISQDNVLMIIDVLNPYETFISDINKYVKKENLTVLINKVDILPRSINHNSIIEWIDEISSSKNIHFSQLSLVSASKKTNIDAIASFILKSDRNTSIVGYSNVGKSSIIAALFKSVGIQINNLITNSIGTTKEVIELKYKDKLIKDYPGIILEGSYQNIMDMDQLKETHPKKEIKLTNYQLNDFQQILIGNYSRFNIKKQEGKLGYQFAFSNLVELHRGKYLEYNDMIKYVIKHKKGIRYDIIISGLGIITFKSIGQEIEIELPKGVKFNLIKSLYQ